MLSGGTVRIIVMMAVPIVVILAGWYVTTILLRPPAPRSPWKDRAPMPTARQHLAVAVADDGTLYAVGGMTGLLGPMAATLEVYDPAAETWTKRAPMPTPRDHLATAFVGGKLYAIGGGTLEGPNPGFLSTVEEYDPATNTWTAKAPMPTRRESFGLAAANGKLYAIGGVTFSGSTIQAAASVEEYDPATDRWITKAALPTPRTGLAVVTGPNGKLYAVGGYKSAPLATVDEYDPATDTWTTKAPLLKARSSHGLAVANGKLYAIGGLTRDLKPTVEEYDLATDRWTLKGPMPTNERRSMGVASVNGKVYAVGGCINGACPSATVDAFDPAA